MEITGKKNLSLLKRALLSHITYCSLKALTSPEAKSKEVYDPELIETENLLRAVTLNIERTEDLLEE